MAGPETGDGPASRRRAAIGGLALVLAILLSLGILAGFFGDRLPLFDSMAHFRAHAALLLLASAAVLGLARLWAAGLASLFTALLGLATVYPYMLALPQAPASRADAPRYTLLQMNLRFDTPDKAQTMRLIGQLSPDVVTAQETSGDWKRAFDGLRERYPYQYFCAPPEHDGDAAILSRRPFAEGDPGICNVGGGFAAKRIDFNGIQLVVGSEHLRWPYPGRQWRQIGALGPTLATLGDPLIIAGDFNATPWSAAVRRMAAASGTRVVQGVGPTWSARMFPSAFARYAGLPIDNVLASDGVEILDVERPLATTSDHLPVFVTFTLRFAQAQEPPIQTVER